MANSYSKHRVNREQGNKSYNYKILALNPQPVWTCNATNKPLLLFWVPAITCNGAKWVAIENDLKWNMCYCSSKVDPSTLLQENLVNIILYCTIQLMFYFSNCKGCFTYVHLSVMEATVSRVQVEESWHWTYSYPTSSWLMTHSRSQPSMSCGAEQSLKGFSKWWSHAWGWWWRGHGFSAETGWTFSSGMLSAQLTLSSASRLSSIVRARAAYWQGHWFPD